jgi:hypothetical protein
MVSLPPAAHFMYPRRTSPVRSGGTTIALRALKEV